MKKLVLAATAVIGLLTSCVSEDLPKVKEPFEFRGEVEVLDVYTMQARRIPVLLQLHDQNLIAIDVGVWLRVFPRRAPSGHVYFEQEVERFMADGSLATYSSPSVSVHRPTSEFRYAYFLANSVYADEATPIKIRKPNQSPEPAAPSGRGSP